MPLRLWFGEAATARSQALQKAQEARTIIGRRWLPRWRMKRLRRRYRIPR